MEWVDGQINVVLGVGHLLRFGRIGKTGTEDQLERTIYASISKQIIMLIALFFVDFIFYSSFYDRYDQPK